MFVETNHTQEQKKQKVCDWNHLLLSVTVPAKPTSRRDRDLELTGPYFAAQTKTFEHEDQNATKITSAFADSCIQSPWPVMSILVRTLCLCLDLMTIFLSVFHFSFSPSCATMSSSKPIGVRREQVDTESCSAPCRPLLWSSGGIDEEKMQPETNQGARKCRY